MGERLVFIWRKRINGFAWPVCGRRRRYSTCYCQALHNLRGSRKEVGSTAEKAVIE